MFTHCNFSEYNRYETKNSIRSIQTRLNESNKFFLFGWKRQPKSSTTRPETPTTVLAITSTKSYNSSSLQPTKKILQAHNFEQFQLNKNFSFKNWTHTPTCLTCCSLHLNHSTTVEWNRKKFFDENKNTCINWREVSVFWSSWRELKGILLANEAKDYQLLLSTIWENLFGTDGNVHVRQEIEGIKPQYDGVERKWWNEIE